MRGEYHPSIHLFLSLSKDPPILSLSLKAHPSQMSTHITLLRHGQSTFNVQKRFQGRSDDSVLTDIGRLTAYRTGLALRSTRFDAIYVSPLQRAQETAQEVCAAIAPVTPPPPIYTHPHLREVHLPQWQGLSYEEVRSRFAEDYRQWQETPHQLQMALTQPDASSSGQPSTITRLPPPAATFSPLHQLYTQAAHFWQEVLPEHPDQNVLIVSHGGTNRALISTAIGLHISRYHILQQSNCGISCLRFSDPQQPAQLQSLNLTSHLGEVLPKLKNGKQGLRLILLPIGPETSDFMPIATRLQSIPLNTCITDGSDRAQAIASTILSDHPDPVLQSFHSPNFLADWHPDFYSKMSFPTELHTLLFISNANQIRSFLHHELNLPLHLLAVTLKPTTLSVLFYPTSTRYPVLQTMNLGE